MVPKGCVLIYVFAWSVCVLALWAGGVCAAATIRYDTATPYTPPQNKFKYYANFDDGLDPDGSGLPVEEQTSNTWNMAPSEIFLTGLRTILDVVRNINKQRASARTNLMTKNSTVVVIRSSPKNASAVSGRGFEDYYDEHHHEETTTTTAKPMKQGRYTDPWAGYYDWIINEGSFKFWSAFQLFTAALLLYACFSAIYYAKFNPILPDYNMAYDDYFLERSVSRSARSLDPMVLPSGLSWINPSTFQFILDAISKHYEEE